MLAYIKQFAPGAVLLVLCVAPGDLSARPRPGLSWSASPRWHVSAKRTPLCHRWKKVNGRYVKLDCVVTPKPRPRAPTRRPSARPEDPPASPSLRPHAPAGSPSLRPPSPAPTPPRVARGAAVPLYNATAVMRLDRAACFDLLKEHHVAFTPVPAAEAREVEIPIRLRGPLEGVRFTIPWSEDEAHDHHAIWDCRLAAAMLPLAAFLSAAGIDEVAYFSALRRGRIVRRKPRSRHNVGLAIDILGFRRGDGPLWKVEDHYPRRTLRECGGRTSARPISPGDHFLEFVCFAHTHGLVHTLLTPDHDRDHANHLHLDLKTGQRDPPDPFTSFHGV